MSDQAALTPVITGAAPAPFSVRIRSRIFRMLFPVWTAVSCTLCLPLLLRKESRGATFSGRMWSAGVVWLLRAICNVTCEVRGEEHLTPHKGPFVFVSNHQSAWETAIFLYIRDHPAYILKKELLKVPLFGLFLEKLEMIAIDRSAGGAALKTMCRDAKKRLEEQRDIVLFPEGTRVAAGENLPFQPGAAMLYRLMPEGTKMVPVALNSAAHWSARRNVILPGKIILEYGAPLADSLDKTVLMQTLEADIIARRDALMQESAEKLA